jgi:hypothetical protein
MFMKSDRLIGVIPAAMLLVSSFVGAAIAQQNEAAALYDRAAELYRAGKFSEALPLVQRLLAIHGRALGPDHPEVATALTWLTALYQEQDPAGRCEVVAGTQRTCSTDGAAPLRRRIPAALGPTPARAVGRTIRRSDAAATAGAAVSGGGLRK